MAKESYAIVIIAVDGGGPAIEVIRGFKSRELAKKAADNIYDIKNGSESWVLKVSVIRET
jgi:hypothetical protein